jgi:vacuolar-type H+-ATPase subunit H
MGKAEILHQIKEAEEKVRAMTKEAEEKRKQLQAEGKRRALGKIDAAEAAQRKQSEARIAEAQGRIAQRRKALVDDGARKAESLAADARRNSAKVKEFVLTEFERAVDA